MAGIFDGYYKTMLTHVKMKRGEKLFQFSPNNIAYFISNQKEKCTDVELSSYAINLIALIHAVRRRKIESIFPLAVQIFFIPAPFHQFPSSI